MGAGAEPLAELLHRDAPQARRLNAKVPFCSGISLILPLSTRRRMQREGRQHSPAAIPLEPLYGEDPPWLSAAQGCNAASLPLHARLTAQTLTHAACIRIKKPLNLRKEKL